MVKRMGGGGGGGVNVVVYMCLVDIVVESVVVFG